MISSLKRNLSPSLALELLESIVNVSISLSSITGQKYLPAPLSLGHWTNFVGSVRGRCIDIFLFVSADPRLLWRNRGRAPPDELRTNIRADG